MCSIIRNYSPEQLAEIGRIENEIQKLDDNFIHSSSINPKIEKEQFEDYFKKAAKLDNEKAAILHNPISIIMNGIKYYRD